MSRRSLRPQLNQIRAWVRQGRTDAWIAHQLEVSASELREFRKQHDLSPDGDGDATPEVDLRDEIEAEIEAAAAEEEKLEAEKAEAEAAEAAKRAAEEPEAPESGDDETESDGGEAEGRPRRRRRRGRRGKRSQSNELEGTFDHGDEGYGLWLDPAIQDVPAYAEKWAGNRAVTVTVEEDQIIIRRVTSDDDE
ncbi:MAG: hypothetical protein WBW62_01465 [Solirubrobacterales bacterium]